MNDQKPLSTTEIQRQLQEYAARTTGSAAARSLRYDRGMHQPGSEEPASPDSAPLVVTSGVTETSWQCTRCGAALEADQLNPIPSRSPVGGEEVAMCPHCGGLARSLYREAARRAEETLLLEQRKRVRIRNMLLSGGAGLLFLLMPNSITYPGAWLASLWFGPCAGIHPKMKMGAMIAAIVAGFVCNGYAAGFDVAYPYSLALWGLATLVILGAGWLIERLASLGGGLFYKG